MANFAEGESVAWNSGLGTATGVVQEVITEQREIDGSMVSASPNDPRYLVKNDHTGKTTVHTDTALKKTANANGAGGGMGGGGSGGTQEFQEGDRVKWNSINGTIVGTVVERITSDRDVNGSMARASQDNPQYIVKSENTGEMAHHKPTALSRA